MQLSWYYSFIQHTQELPTENFYFFLVQEFAHSAVENVTGLHLLLFISDIIVFDSITLWHQIEWTHVSPDFLNFDDVDDDEDDAGGDYAPDVETARAIDNSGWSSRTKYVYVNVIL